VYAKFILGGDENIFFVAIFPVGNRCLL